MSRVGAHLPGTPARNGMPQRVNYAYRGTGEDTRTAHVGDEELKAWKPDYEQWIPPMPRGTSAGRQQ